MEPPSKRARGFEDEDAPPEVLAEATADATADSTADAAPALFLAPPSRALRTRAREFPRGNDGVTQGVAWSPDGSCLLVACERRALRLFEAPVSSSRG